MGQYYTPLLISSNNRIEALTSYSFDNGAKLMEHSWIGNDFVNAAYALIFGKPKKVAWIGDYANNPYEPSDDAYARAMPHEEFKKYYDLAFEDESIVLPPKYFSSRGLKMLDYETRDMYLVNHSRKSYLNLEEYIRKCTIGRDWCINPLPLLTACGNDRGGGDFREGNIGYEDVGIWAFDVLEYTASIPADYEKVQFKFIEK